jgi:hypothetical protein
MDLSHEQLHPFVLLRDKKVKWKFFFRLVDGEPLILFTQRLMEAMKDKSISVSATRIEVWDEGKTKALGPTNQPCNAFRHSLKAGRIFTEGQGALALQL